MAAEISPSSKKRPLPADEERHSPPKGNTLDMDDMPLVVDSTERADLESSVPRGCSPSPSSTTSLAADRKDSTNSSPQKPAPDSSAQAPMSSTATQKLQKRRRLTPSEKKAMRQEKEAKAREREEKRAKREEEQRLKDEERRKKNEEREEKKRAKELEQQQKEEEKRKREEEKRKKEAEKEKKEKAQLRLNAFFNKPRPSNSSPNNSSTPSLISTYDTTTQEPQPPTSPTKSNDNSLSGVSISQGTAKSDYKKVFLPFEVPAHTMMAPNNAQTLSKSELSEARSKLNALVNRDTSEDGTSTDVPIKGTPDHPLSQFFGGGKGSSSMSRGIRYPCVKNIMEHLEGTPQKPLELDCAMSDQKSALELLKTVPMKYIHFHEDVRPPYCGTYTRLLSQKQVRMLATNPCSRVLPDVDYDYDSEAEWVETGDEVGHDIDMEDEEEEEDDGDEEMKDFLDDDECFEDVRPTHHLITGELVPSCTGLCWEGADGKVRSAETGAEVDFAEYKVASLLRPIPKTIDPYTTSYWPGSASRSASGSGAAATSAFISNSTRAPKAINLPSALLQRRGRPQSAAAAAAEKKKRMVDDAILPAFKEAIAGSDMTKLALIEALKKMFPGVPKDAISNTIGAVAARIGNKEANKRWFLFTDEEPDEMMLREKHLA
ncbi:chromatin assembly factor 1 subunit A-domain-containing protein [Lineolata rhizophorae]|uniref:Chromatin assembly factor 1 subunit A-domain-containing protein n=1 Tax=Lineolata rhizophorae TaxID=578093 RepID=A0A6A6NVQ9_9PEZI|nr:chromatin assembly factor 1 subunit A-domain-containing protein [Lineolata rhizophorae]